MSWIVESLLNDRDRIREDGNIESEEFNDLMLVEKAIDSLRKSGKLTDADLDTIYLPKTDGLTKNEKWTINKKRAFLCERVAYYMGDYFTDDGYLNHIQNKHNLTKQQVDTLRKYIKSEYKHKIMRKPIND